MKKFGDYIQSADWKSEKHVPVIEAPGSAGAGEVVEITASVGKEIAHPNTTEHHIRWIQLFYKPEDEKFAYQLSNAEFTVHGEAVAGANKGPAYSEPSVTVKVKLNKSGTLTAVSYCNIHGVWEDSKDITIS